MSKHHNVKTNATIGLYVEHVRKDGFINFTAYPVWIGLRPSEMARIDRGDRIETLAAISPERIVNIGGWEDGDGLINGVYLDDLKVTAQGNDDRDRERGPLYAFEVDYRQVYSIDRRKAELMALTLAKVEKRLALLHEKYGPASTYPAYVLRVANAIGASRIVAQRTTNGETDYRRREHRIMSLSDGAAFVEGQIRAWQESAQVGAVSQ